MAEKAGKYCCLLTSLLVVFRLAPTTAQGMPPRYSAASQELDSPSYPVYQMVVFFLERILQPNYLTKMEAYVETPDAFVSSWQNHWNEWLIYIIGFVVCVSIGIALFIAIFFVCCCNCCCRTTSTTKTDVEDEGQADYDDDEDYERGFSRGCCVSCTVVMVLLGAGLVLAIVPMFSMNDRVNVQASTGLWQAANATVDEAYGFLTDAVEDIDAVFYGGYVDAESQVFQILYRIPVDVLAVLENATGLGSAVRMASTFAVQLPDLDTNLTAADVIVKDLQKNSSYLEQNLINGLVPEILNSPHCNGTLLRVCEDVKSIHLVANFSQIDLTNAVTVVDQAVVFGFAEMVQNVTRQILKISEDLNNTVISAIDQAANQSQSVKAEIESLVTSINGTVASLDVDGAKETLTKIPNDDVYVMVVDIVYWTILGLIVMLCIVAGLLLVGLLFGSVLPFRKSPSSSCCGSKSCGSSFLLVGSGLTFSFYWLYMLLLVLLFAVGGLFHTEACRHLTSVGDDNSFAVLQIFDRWLNQSLYNNTGMNISILPFDTLKQCSENASIYKALHLEEGWNITELTRNAETEINKVFEDLKGTAVQLPHVDLTDPQLDQLLVALESVFSEEALNFTAIFENIRRNIVEPNLTQIAQSLNDSGMPEFVSRMQGFADLVVSMEADKAKLIDHLEIVESIVKDVSFLHIAQVFNSSEAVINENGTAIASKFVNDTADRAESIFVQFTRSTADQLENEVALCFSLYMSVESTVDAACVHFLYAVNGFWFCLGWYLFFLFVMVVILPELVKMYRSQGPKVAQKSIEENALVPKTVAAAAATGVVVAGTTSKDQEGAKPTADVKAAPAAAVVAQPQGVPQGQVTTAGTQPSTSSANGVNPAGVAVAGAAVAVIAEDGKVAPPTTKANGINGNATASVYSIPTTYSPPSYVTSNGEPYYQNPSSVGQDQGGSYPASEADEPMKNFAFLADFDITSLLIPRIGSRKPPGVHYNSAYDPTPDYY